MRYATYFASTYGSDAYNTNVYSTGSTTSTGTGGTGSTAAGTGESTIPGSLNNSGNPLANTGFDLILGATIGSIIIFSALVIRFWKNPGKQQTTEA
jgi:hypothetical protein